MIWLKEFILKLFQSSGLYVKHNMHCRLKKLYSIVIVTNYQTLNLKQCLFSEHTLFSEYTAFLPFSSVQLNGILIGNPANGTFL